MPNKILFKNTDNKSVSYLLEFNRPDGCCKVSYLDSEGNEIDDPSLYGGGLASGLQAVGACMGRVKGEWYA